MPLARYFLYVGGVLLTLLFAMDAVLPHLTDGAALPKLADSGRTDAGPDKSIIRIRSDRKWPEPIVIDTSLPTIVPAAAAKVAAIAPPAVSEASPKARVREAFAQLPRADVKDPEPKKPEVQPQRKRKIAKARVAPPRILVAQQPRFGFFDGSMW
jgi:hypothetical protein